jgi:hypothetical protein
MFAAAWGYNSLHASGIPATPRIEFKSNQISEVRRWIRSRTGIDIPLLMQSDASVEMMGASIAETGAVEVRYRVGGQQASLLVSRFGGVSAEHRHLSGDSLPYATTVSWSTGQQSYTLAVERAGGMRAACVVCHAELDL